ncbi:hypothetical protein D918_04422 [Trichuris suis]|nr:hypothetical protein D918_04422 [Trichuris suis]
MRVREKANCRRQRNVLYCSFYRHKDFVRDCPSGLLKREEFQTIYRQFFPEGDPSKFSSFVFNVFDVNKDGYISFPEFIHALSITSRGSIDEKLEWAFSLYDLDSDGYITRQEMVEIVTAIYTMLGRQLEVKKLAAEDTPEMRVDKIFDSMDTVCLNRFFASCGCGVTMNLLGVLIVLLFITCRTVGREESFSIVIPASRLQCFFESVREDNFTTMVFDYQVLYGGDLDINVLVLDPKADVVAQDTRKSEGSYQIELHMKGDYQICFDNTFSYQTAKTVFFQVELLRADGTTDDFGVSALNDPTGIVTHVGLFSEVLKERLQRLRQKLTAAERFQALARAHETRDRLLMDEKLNRVNFWSMFNMSSLLIVGGLQIYIIRSLFEDNSKVGRLLRQGF